MFYIKHHGEKVFLGEAPVYCICPNCGQEHEADEIWDLMADDPDFDIYSCDLWCKACGLEKRVQGNGGHNVRKRALRLL